MDPKKEIEKLKLAEQVNSVEKPSSGLDWPIIIGFVVIGLGLAIGWIWLLSGGLSRMDEPSEPFYPTPIVTLAWQVTRPLVNTPTLQPTQPPQPIALVTTAAPTWTAVPSLTPAATWTPYPTLTTAPTWTPQATWTTAPTYTPQATHTPYPSPTAVPTDTPTPIPTATVSPTPTPPPAALPVTGIESVRVVESGQPWWFHALVALEIILVLFIIYMELGTWKHRRNPPTPTTPTRTRYPQPISRITPPHPRHVTSSESSRRVQPVEPVEPAPAQEVQLPLSKERPPDATERAYIRRRYAETGNLTAVCMECYNSKGGKVWAWIKEAIEEIPVEQGRASQAARQFAIRTNGGKRYLEA